MLAHEPSHISSSIHHLLLRSYFVPDMTCSPSAVYRAVASNAAEILNELQPNNYKELRNPKQINQGEMSEHEVQCECFISECLLIFLMPTHAINSLQKLFSIEFLGERRNGILWSLSSRSSSAIRNKQLTGSGLWVVHERGVENFCFRANRFHIKCLYFISV